MIWRRSPGIPFNSSLSSNQDLIGCSIHKSVLCLRNFEEMWQYRGGGGERRVSSDKAFDFTNTSDFDAPDFDAVDFNTSDFKLQAVRPIDTPVDVSNL